MDQPGKVANPARPQLHREMNFSLSPFVPKKLISRRETGSAVPSRRRYSNECFTTKEYIRVYVLIVQARVKWRR